MTDAPDDAVQQRTPLLHLFLIFLRLGCTAFGGPAAHLAHYHAEFVERRRWLDESSYTRLLALCQFLPGPASSQMGMAIGLTQRGLPGMAAAWTAFTLPTALLMTAAAIGVTHWQLDPQAGWGQGLLAAVVAVVAFAVWSLGRKCCDTGALKSVMLIATAGSLLLPLTWQVLVIGIAALVGILAPRCFTGEHTTEAPDSPVSGRVGTVALILVIALLALPLLVQVIDHPLLDLSARLVRSGALVFGGGHVVLPLLQAETVPQFIAVDTFYAGYGAAQAMPGPLFGFSAYVGGAAAGTGDLRAVLWAAVACVALFAPGALLLLAALPVWQRGLRFARLRAAVAAAGAAVVGLLLATLLGPVRAEAWHGEQVQLQMAISILALAGLAIWRIPAWAVVVLSAGLGAILL